MRRRGTLVVMATLLAGGCRDQAELHTSALTPGAGAVATRALQSRRFDTRDDAQILSAGAGVLQDLGFIIEETAAGSGLITASKDRSAVEAGQVAGQVFLMLLAAAAGTQYNPVFDRDQRIRVTIVVQRPPGRQDVVARASFQRVVVNSQNQVSRIETLQEPELYRQFFEMLAQSAFLEAHEI